MKEYRYISAKEFPRCSPPCSIDDMDSFFLSRLDTARNIAGVPFYFSSAYRSYEHELRNNRDGSSAHTKGLAIDILFSSSKRCYKIVKSLMDVGFLRIIIYRSWIHVDMDESKTAPILKVK